LKLNWVGIDDFVFGLHHRFGHGLFKLFVLVFLIDFIEVSRSVRLGLLLFDLPLYVFVVISLFGDVLLELGLELINVLVGKKLVGGLDFDLKKAWLAALALQIFQDLVVSRALFFVLCEDSIHTIDCRVSHEFLEVH
jgi:hypothetical protein